jgi:hypothetical protein
MRLPVRSAARSAVFLFCALAWQAAAVAQNAGPVTAPSPVGIFDNHADIGNPKNAGGTFYDAAAQIYTIRGSGYNIWFNRDEFQYAYKKVGGDFVLTANFEFSGAAKGADGHRKIGWMIREAADEGAACSNACMHIDGLTVLQWRPYRGMYMRDPEEEIFAPKKGGQIMRLERVGKKITMSIAHPGEPLQVVGSYASEMKDSVLVGIYICAHDSNSVAEGRVWNVRIDKPVVNDYSSNPHFKAAPEIRQPGQRLETLDVLDGVRKIVLEASGGMTSPGWTPDGSAVAGIVYPPVDKALPQGSNFSPDRKTIYYNDPVTGTNQIWRMKADGSGKEQLTFDEYHNWFPKISPDGKWIVFISYPPDTDPNAHPLNKRVMLRLMPVGGGAPKVIAYLYGGGDAGETPAWSKDGKHLAFISHSGVGKFAQ